MDLLSPKNLVLASIAMILTSEVFSFLYKVLNSIGGLVGGLVVLCIYVYCGAKARKSIHSTTWFLVPTILFTLVPLAYKWWPNSEEESISVFNVLIQNVPVLISFVLPVIFLSIVYYKLSKT
jgi:hypothetical protein